MKRSHLLALLAVVACTGTTEAVAADAEWLFTPDHVTEIDFAIPQASRDALAADPREYVEAYFTLTDEEGTSHGPL